MLSLDFVTFVRTTGYLGLFLLIFAESGLLIGAILPGGDTLLVTVGFLASQGLLNIRVVVPLCLIAAVIGYDAGYLFGRYATRRLFERGDSGWFRREHLLRAETFFAKFGGNAIVLGRFVPVVRTFMPIAAGVAAFPYARFALFNAAGAILWAGGAIWVGYFLGDRILGAIQTIFGQGRDLRSVIVVTILACAALAVYLWRRYASSREKAER